MSAGTAVEGNEEDLNESRSRKTEKTVGVGPSIQTEFWGCESCDYFPTFREPGLDWKYDKTPRTMNPHGPSELREEKEVGDVDIMVSKIQIFVRHGFSRNEMSLTPGRQTFCCKWPAVNVYLTPCLPATSWQDWGPEFRDPNTWSRQSFHQNDVGTHSPMTSFDVQAERQAVPGLPSPIRGAFLQVHWVHS